MTLLLLLQRNTYPGPVGYPNFLSQSQRSKLCFGTGLPTSFHGARPKRLAFVLCMPSTFRLHSPAIAPAQPSVSFRGIVWLDTHAVIITLEGGAVISYTLHRKILTFVVSRDVCLRTVSNACPPLRVPIAGSAIQCKDHFTTHYCWRSKSTAGQRLSVRLPGGCARL